MAVEARDASNSSVHYFFSDHLGSTSVTTDSIGATMEEDLDYYPYGGVASGSSSDHYLFTGKERDTESGLDNFGARYMASTMGRFMSPDPSNLSVDWWLPQTWNRYTYGLNNPLTMVDKNGLWPSPVHFLMNAESFPNAGSQNIRLPGAPDDPRRCLCQCGRGTGYGTVEGPHGGWPASRRKA